MWFGPNVECVVCDIDGTIVNDGVFDKIAFAMVYAMHCDFDANIVFLTDRTIDLHDETVKWLDAMLASYDLEYIHDYDLFMKADDDTRDEVDYKLDTLRDIIVLKYGDVMIAYDDNHSVVDRMIASGHRAIHVSN